MKNVDQRPLGTLLTLLEKRAEKRVLVLWECEIKHSLAECVARIRQEFSSANQKRVRPSSLLPNEIGARPRKRSVKLGGPG